MPWLDFDALDQVSDRFDAEVARTPHVDQFCTSADWTLCAQRAFVPQAQPFIYRVEGVGTVALLMVPFGGGRLALPLESGWGLASAFAGDTPTLLVNLLGEMMARAPQPPHGLFLSGIDRESPWFGALLQRFGRDWRLGLGGECARRGASLAGGMDGFYARRSAHFRANLRRSARRAEAEGFEYLWFDRPQPGAETEALFERLMAVERQSWKGVSGHGVDEGEGNRFYRLMVQRLARRGAFRAVILCRDGHDLAYVFGGLFNGTYRGLQVSFNNAYRAWSPGNLVQLEMISRLCAEGVGLYDLGTEMDYKVNWGEQRFNTVTLTILPRTMSPL